MDRRGSGGPVPRQRVCRAQREASHSLYRSRNKSCAFPCSRIETSFCKSNRRVPKGLAVHLTAVFSVFALPQLGSSGTPCRRKFCPEERQRRMRQYPHPVSARLECGAPPYSAFYRRNARCNAHAEGAGFAAHPPSASDGNRTPRGVPPGVSRTDCQLWEVREAA